MLKVENLFINLHNVPIELIIEKRVLGHAVPDRSLVIEWLYFYEYLTFMNCVLGVLKVENHFKNIAYCPNRAYYREKGLWTCRS